MEKLFYLGFQLSLTHLLGFVALILLLYVSAWSLVAIAKKRADLADVAWGPGFILVAWSSLALGRVSIYGIIVNLLVTAWGIRLFIHLYLRNRNRGEDFRYETLKQKWKSYFNLRLFTDVFLLQGCILYIVALPVIWIHAYSDQLPSEIVWVALIVWLSGFVIETIADWQLTLFKKNRSNKGKLLMVGLWGYVRHPNYLGELMQWWSIWLMAAFLPFGWVLIISPLLLTFIIVSISGVRPLEEELHKRADFKVYAKNTPALIPLSLLNGILYGLTWFILIMYSSHHSNFITIATALTSYFAQMTLFAKFDRGILWISLPLSLFALGLGLVQEVGFIYFGVLIYPETGVFPPLWILVLYPLFSLTLNSSLAFLNKSLVMTFFLGGFGALFSYLSGERLGAVQLFPLLSYGVIFLFWGISLTLLIIVNRLLRRNICCTNIHKN